jgi:thioredoxin 1
MMKVDITSENFQKEVRKSSGFMLVMYWAEWCKVCEKTVPVFDEIVHEYLDSPIRFGMGNVDDDPQLISLNELMVIPTIMLYMNGDVIIKMEGIKTKEELREVLKTQISRLGS